LADQYFLKSLEVNPADKKCLRLYAEFLVRRGHKEEAAQFVELARTYSTASSIKEETIFENERRAMFSKEYSKANLLLTDTRGPWSNKKDTPKKMEDGKHDIVLYWYLAFLVELTPGWEWVDNWKIDTSRLTVDSEGWEYAFNWSGDWYNKPSTLAYVRRRRWKRTRQYKMADEIHEQATNEQMQSFYMVPKL
jgi:hypothetical protein